MNKKKLGLVGAGNMAQAIASAAIEHGTLQADQIIAYDPQPQRVKVFAGMGVTMAASVPELVAVSEQVMLAVKPQVVPQVAADMASALTSEHVVLSIMAGVTTDRLAKALGQPTRVVRIMPNTPMMVGMGMAGISCGANAQPGDDALAMRLFTAGGSEAISVDEAQLDAITAVSGSGPAYLFYLAQAMEQAAVDMGLSASQSALLVSQTLRGASQMLVESPNTPQQLRQKVTSPGGTTQAAIEHLQSHDVLQTVVDALRAAETRSQTLGQ